MTRFHLLLFALLVICFPAIAALDDADSVALLHFDENTIDESGKIWTAVGTAVATSTDYKFPTGSALFDKSAGQGIISSDSADWNVEADFTIDFWVNWSDPFTSGGNFCGQSEGGGPNLKWMFGYDAAAVGLFSFFSFDGTSNQATNFGTVVFTPTPGQWYHIALVRSGSNYHLFIDGILQETAVDTRVRPNVSADIYIGQDGEDFRRHKGFIDEFRFSKVARWTSSFTPPSGPYGPPAPKIAAIRLAPGGSVAFGRIPPDPGAHLHFNGDLSDDNGRVWVAVGAAIATTTAAKFGSGSLFSSGGGNHIYATDTPEISTGGDFAVESWFLPGFLPVSATPGYSRQWEQTQHGALYVLSYVSTVDGSSTYNLRVSVDISNFFYASAPIALATDTWTHLAFQRAGNTWKMFQDGALIYSTTPAWSFPEISGYMVIQGAPIGPSNAWNAYHDEVRYSSGVARFPDSFVPPDKEYTTPPPMIALGDTQ